MFADYTKLCRTIKAEEDSEISQTEAPGHGPRFWWMIGKIGSLAASRYITLWFLFQGSNPCFPGSKLLHPISYRFGVIAAYCSNFAPTRSLSLKISGRRGRPHQSFLHG